jgi:hypothetical protein
MGINMTDHFDLIAAFADGEHVEVDALKAALADEAGRDYLVDLLALRGLVSEAPASRAAAVEMPKRSTAWRLVPMAALLVAGVSGGFAMGRQSTAPMNQSAPMAPVVTAEAIPPELRIPAPAPTRVIKLEAGTSWNERSGGN